MQLIAEYSGEITGNGKVILTIPEIKGRKYSTSIECSYKNSTEDWTHIPMTWSVPYKRCYNVSWDGGRIHLYEMMAGDIHKIQIHQK